MTAPAARIEAPRQSARVPEAQVAPLFVERWSRRALTERPLTPAQISTLFEAARWAPSASNLQPWLFVYASQPETLAQARTLLKDANQRWASRAPLLVFAFARRRHPETGAPLRTAAFDTGAAWQSIALQAHELGLSARAMGGIHLERTYEVLNVAQDEYEALIGIAIGYPDERASLPADLLEKEQPNQRKQVREFAFEGRHTR